MFSWKTNAGRLFGKKDIHYFSDVVLYVTLIYEAPPLHYTKYHSSTTHTQKQQDLQHWSRTFLVYHMTHLAQPLLFFLFLFLHHYLFRFHFLAAKKHDQPGLHTEANTMCNTLVQYTHKEPVPLGDSAGGAAV